MPITPPKFKTCGKSEWRHVCLGPAPTLKEIREATAALERAFPSSHVVAPYKGSDTIDHHGKQATSILQAPKPARLVRSRSGIRGEL
jgi:hypothetical protein